MRPGLASPARGLGAALAVMLLAALAGPAAAQCGGSQLCPAGTGDCTVAADCTITLPAGGLSIDLGTRRLVITRTLRVLGPANAGLTLKVGNLLLDGGTIVAPGENQFAGNLTILSATDVTVRNNGIIDVSAGLGAGIVELEALGGNLSFTGRVKANGDITRNGFGGQVSLFANGSVSLGGSAATTVAGGDLGGAGSIAIEAATGSIVVGAPLKATGGEGGDIELFAGTTIQTTSAGTLNVDANGDAGSGGSIDLAAGGDVVLGGEVIGTGSQTDFREEGRTGGDGAEVDVSSLAGSVTVSARMDASGAPGGSGGNIDLDAGLNLALSKPVLARTDGVEGLGGSVFLTAGGTMSLAQQVDVSGLLGSGGFVVASSTGGLTLSGSVAANGDRMGGTIDLAGCALNVTSTGALSAQGPGVFPSSTITLEASSTMTIRGTLRATVANRLRHRAPPAPSTAGAVIQPAATIQLDPTLPCCVSCPATTTTTTAATSTTTSSTTTRPGATTTTVPAVCGNGVVTGAEQCDDGNTAGGDCCSPSCTFEPASSPCASDANPCTRDVCNGSGLCTHPAGNAGVTCRAAAGACDQAETCSGTAATCPPDGKRTGVCRAAAGACDQAESCDGSGNACPADAFASAATVCRAVAGLCDRPETCTGTGPACPADQLAPPGTVCRAAAGVCDVAETCTGTSGVCPADTVVPNGTACPGNGCTTGGTCQSGACSGGVPISCGPCETCDGAGGCSSAPRAACRRPSAPAKARLSVKDSLSGPRSDRVQWKWSSGAATTLDDFGDPAGSNGLTLCIFDRSRATPALLFKASVPAGGTCGTRPCWAGNGRSFKFVDRTGQPDGVAKVTLLPGVEGRARILLKAQGTSLSERPFGLPTPPLPLPLTVQLQSDTGQCWEASYVRSGLKANDGQTFDGTAE